MRHLPLSLRHQSDRRSYLSPELFIARLPLPSSGGEDQAPDRGRAHRKVSLFVAIHCDVFVFVAPGLMEANGAETRTVSRAALPLSLDRLGRVM